MAEMGPVIDIRNTAIVVAVVPIALVATVVSRGLLALPSGLLRSLRLFTLRCLLALRLLLALSLLLALRLRLALSLLLALRLRLVLSLLLALRLVLSLLLALRLRLVLSLLLALRLRLVLSLLLALRLRLVLRLRCSSSTALFLFAFLRESRNRGAEEHQQNCCADNSIVCHRCVASELISFLPLAKFQKHNGYTVCHHSCQFITAHGRVQ